MSIKKNVLIFGVLLFAFAIYKYSSVDIQSLNSRCLVNTGQASRVYPHRVNTIGKLHDIWEDGFRSFEVDVIFGYMDRKVFQLGHDPDAIGKTDLEHLILSVNYKDIDRIWLDLKNLTAKNHEDVIKRLEYLQSKYDIKNKVILESSIRHPVFAVFSERGWHTSYYLPTWIKDILSSEDVAALRKEATRISAQVKTQKLSAVSFDNRLMPFVKNYLEPRISSEVVYHTWWGPSLKKITFALKLLVDEQYMDDRVKSILVEYKSRYSI